MDAKPGETSDAAGAGKPDSCGRAAGVVTGLATQARRAIGRWCSGIVRGPSISYMEGPRPILTDPRKLCRKRHAIGHRFGRPSRDDRPPRRRARTPPWPAEMRDGRRVRLPRRRACSPPRSANLSNVGRRARTAPWPAEMPHNGRSARSMPSRLAHPAGVLPRATGGNATGGNASGGNATGGNASGGNAPGGNASGGSRAPCLPGTGRRS